VQQLRLAAVGTVIASVLLLTGCSGGDGDAAAPTTPGAAGVIAPTGAPSDLTPVTGASGTSTDLGGAATITLPAGATSEDPTTTANGHNQVFRMPGADATTKLPAVSVLWQDKATAGAVEQSWATEKTRVAQGATNYVRSSVTWPGSVASVVATWDESVAMQDGSTLQTQALGLWLQSKDGSVVFAIAFAKAGELDGSAALDAIRTITLG
jgi:hypothetical protein